MNPSHAFGAHVDASVFEVWCDVVLVVSVADLFAFSPCWLKLRFS